MPFSPLFRFHGLNQGELGTRSARTEEPLSRRISQASYCRRRPKAKATSLCAGHAQQFGGESPPANLMEVRPSDDARATAARRGLKEAWSKRASRWTKTGYQAPALDERATYREVHIHQGCEA